MNPILQLYLVVRKPRNFLVILCAFIAASLLLHFFRAYDDGFGLTNLILSIEASTASAVLLMVAEASSVAQEKMLKTILSLEKKVLKLQERILEEVEEIQEERDE